MEAITAILVFSLSFSIQEGSEDSRFRGVGKILELNDARIADFYHKSNSEFINVCLVWRRTSYWAQIHIDSARLQLRAERRYVGLSGTIEVGSRICKNAVISAPRIPYYLIRRQIAEFRRNGGG